MEQVIMKKVLEEILDEQKNTNADKKQLADALEQLVQQVKNFDSKLLTVRLNVPAINLSNLEHFVNAHLQTVELYLNLHFKKVEQLQKKKELKEQILYWLPWLIVVILCAVIFRIAIGGQFHGSIF